MNRKRLTALSASCLLWMLCMLAACEQENYDKGDGKYSRLVTAFVEAPTNQERQVVYVDTDEGERLALNAPYTAKWLLKADTTYRAVLYYYEEEKEAVRPYMLASLSHRAARRLVQERREDRPREVRERMGLEDEEIPEHWHLSENGHQRKC